MMRVEMRLTTLYTLMDFKHNHSSVGVPKVRQRVYANFKFFSNRGEPCHDGPPAQVCGDWATTGMLRAQVGEATFHLRFVHQTEAILLPSHDAMVPALSTEISSTRLARRYCGCNPPWDDQLLSCSTTTKSVIDSGEGLPSAK